MVEPRILPSQSRHLQLSLINLCLHFFDLGMQGDVYQPQSLAWRQGKGCFQTSGNLTKFSKKTLDNKNLFCMILFEVRPRLIDAGADLGKVYALCQLEVDQLETSRLEAASRPDVRPEVETMDAGRAGVDHRKGWQGRDVGDVESGGNNQNSESRKIPAGADAVADGPSMQPRMFQWNRDLPVIDAELARRKTSGVEVSLIVIDAVDGFVDAPRRRSLRAADVEKLAALARKFRVAIVLAAHVSPAAMLRSTRPRGMAGIDALSTVARTVWMIARDLDVANGRMLVPIKKSRSMNPNGFAYCLQQGKILWDDEPVGIQGEDFLREAISTPQAPLAREHHH